MLKDNTRKRCQRLWIKAMQEPITLEFSNVKDMHRARFALYDACRKTEDQQLLRAKELVEVCSDNKAFILTMQLRELNPFEDTFMKEIGRVLGEEDSEEEPLGENPGTSKKCSLEPLSEFTRDELAESLRRFQETVCKEKAGGLRPSTPYFNREED